MWAIMQESDDQTLSPSAAVEQVIHEISGDSARLKAKSKDESIFFQNNAAQAMGYDHPYSAEQRAMNTILTELEAGNACCERAWKLFHKLTIGS